MIARSTDGIEPKNCLTCKYAEWDKSANGRRSTKGTGRCTWQMPDIKMPAAYYFIGFHKTFPKPSGGYIRRNTLPLECPTWTP